MNKRQRKKKKGHGRIFILKATGRANVAREGTCLACKYCSDVFWDFTNGPYCAWCSKALIYGEVCKNGLCPYFKPDKTERRVIYAPPSKH